ncbi:MAG: c-type cytochrome domain-containing protein [Byssovorax sp.]
MSDANSKPDSAALQRSIAVAVGSALLAVGFTVALLPTTHAPDFVQFFGRFHTLAIHLPIGVLLLVAAAEALCIVSPSKRARLDPALDLALPFLVLTSVAAFALGILLARGGGYPSRLVLLHRSFTLAAVIGSAVTLVAWVLGRRAAYRGALGFTVLLLTVGAHFGGAMTRGDSYLSRYAPRFLQPLMGGSPAKEAAPVDSAPVITAEPLVFSDVLLPMLKERCVECHGPDQAKGGLRVDSFAALTKGGEHGPVMVAGRGGGSSLVERMTLPAGNDERMPPDNKPAPSNDEIQLVRWWIDRGASETTRVRDGVVPDGARALLSKASVATALPDVNAPPKDPPTHAASATASASAAPSAAPIVAPAAHAGPRLVWRDVVAPLLAARCASCHGDAKQKGKLRVDSIEALVAGGKGGPAIVPGNASGGTLIARSHLPLEDDKHMPPAKEAQLDATQVELIAWWIGQGANATDPASTMPSRFGKMAAVSAVAIRAPTVPTPATSGSTEPSSPPGPPSPVAVTGPVDVYAELITPILRKRCGECHLGEHAMGGLHVDNYEKMVAELDVVPGKPDESAIMKRMLLPMTSDDRMPPTDKPQATPAEIEAVKAWIAKGARRDQSVDAHELPPELLGSVERKPAGVDKGALAIAAPGANPRDKAPDTTPPPAVPPAGAKGCATCSVGGQRDASTAARSLAVAGVLALAYAARRSRKRPRR